MTSITKGQDYAKPVMVRVDRMLKSAFLVKDKEQQLNLFKWALECILRWRRTVRSAMAWDSYLNKEPSARYVMDAKLPKKKLIYLLRSLLEYLQEKSSSLKDRETRW